MKQKSREQLKHQHLPATIAEAAEASKGRKWIDKKSVVLHKAGADDSEPAAGSAGSGTTQSVGAPNAEQLDRINAYTRSPKTADELVVFSTLSANDLPDRDDDMFTTDTIKEFAALPEPYGPTGKSYMTSHNYSNLPVGRIFGTDTKEAEGALFLTNEVYVPNTPEMQPFINAIDFGVNWAVSVGVMMEKQLCSICETNQYSGWYAVCENGHFKSEMYDPDETRTDDWGYIIPALAGDPKAVKCLGLMSGARDFYELSQVFLGAQFYAAIDKQAGTSIKSVLKSAGKVPVLGLSQQEATIINFTHVNPKVADALSRFEVEREGDQLKWVDEDKLVWKYEPGEEVLCLGKQGAGENKEADDGEGQGSGTSAERTPGGSGEGGDPDGKSGSVDDRSGVRSEDQHGVGQQAAAAGEVGAVGDLTQAGAENEQKGSKPLSKQAVIDAARAAKVPGALLAAIAEDTEGNGLEAVLRAATGQITTLSTEVEELRPKAVLGDAYKRSLRTDALDWYVKSHQTTTEQAVSTATFEKILDACGDNLDLITALRDEEEVRAKGKFPGVRRSSMPDNVNELKQPTGPVEGDDDSTGSTTARGTSTVTRIHG